MASPRLSAVLHLPPGPRLRPPCLPFGPEAARRGRRERQRSPLGIDNLVVHAPSRLLRRHPHPGGGRERGRGRVQLGAGERAGGVCYPCTAAKAGIVQTCNFVGCF